MGDFFKEDWFAERKKEAEESKQLDAKKRAKLIKKEPLKPSRHQK